MPTDATPPRARLICDEPSGDPTGDPFAFLPFVDTFVELATNRENRTPFTIVIDGSWGSGKTTLMKMTEAKLTARREVFNGHIREANKVNRYTDVRNHEPYQQIVAFRKAERPCMTFWFNAWKYADEDQILVSLLLNMFRVMEQDQDFWDVVKTKIDYKSVLTGIINSFSQKFTGKDSSEYFHELKLAQRAPFVDEFTTLTRDLIACYCAPEKWEKKDKEKGEGKREEDTEGAFVIFIDDLDRCPPKKTVKVLEAVKLFLDIPGCVFFIGMESRQVEAAVATAYEDLKGFDPSRYLEKIIQVHVKLPPVGGNPMAEYLDTLFVHVNRDDLKEQEEGARSVFLAAGYKTQRGMKRAVNDFLFMKSLADKMKLEGIDEIGIAKWIALNNINDRELREALQNDPATLSFFEEYRRETEENHGDNVADYLSWKSPQEGGSEPYTPMNEERLLRKWDRLLEQSNGTLREELAFLNEGGPSFDTFTKAESYLTLSSFVVVREQTEGKVKRQRVMGWIPEPKDIHPGADLRVADLRGADLMRADLSGADVRGANLMRADVSDADLIDADLRSADVSDADLIDADLRSADLRSAILMRAILMRADLRGADLRGADLSSANLMRADLSGAGLSDANLRLANLKGANLSEAMGLAVGQVQKTHFDAETRFPPEIEDGLFGLGLWPPKGDE